ncbi:tetratricopeptide repeat protein [Roseofilum sp. BLCC_M154]|uniref:Tetratricopeptide repeat protein n=1 Tax=Roseofilum acuticapitatum BLCC-M154 TaxID=3022444 RepID=A0ABT7AWV6_9CYAN|nr:tetratricopeptide repeat protein [Roseofilum acuticapitatum]MDJ1171371.1 tetratricopeptide repeat protein [Roseofilum acuticapitatum BLCC-M154]
MDEQRVQAYLSLIQELLDCPSGEEVTILSNHPELMDEGLVQVMGAEAEKRAQQGQGNAGWLRNFAQKIETANYELPRLEIKLTADALLQQGFQQYQHSEYPQAWQSLQQSLALYQEIGDKAGIANCWGQLGSIQRNRGNWDEAERLYQQCLAIETELGDRSGMASSWGVLGDIQRNRGNWDEAERLYQQSLQLSTELGDRSGMASSWGLLGDIQRNRGNWDEAERLYQKKLDACRELGDKSGMSQVIGTLGDIQRNRGNWDEAERLYQQSLQLSTELGDRSGMASSWGVLGDIQRNRGNWDEAERLYQQCLAIETELGDRSGMATSWGQLGDIQRNRGNWDEAERLFQQSLQLRTELGDKSGMATSYNLLAFVHQQLNRIPEAIASWRAGLAICPPNRFPLEALELGSRLGDAGFDIQDWEIAIEGYEAAISAVETSCTFVESYTEKQKRRTAQLGVYEKLVQACINSGDIGRALASVERSKSRNLIELLANRELYPKGNIPPEILEQLDTLRREVTAKQQLLETLDRPQPPSDPPQPPLKKGGLSDSEPPLESRGFSFSQIIPQQKQNLCFSKPFFWPGSILCQPRIS